MEKIAHRNIPKTKKQRLPALSKNKSNLHMSPNIQEFSISPGNHFQQLRKLYYQYKSNANILARSPYYTNRQQQKHVVSYIQANKCEPSLEQIQNVQDRYSVGEEVLERGKQFAVQSVKIKLHCFSVVLELSLKIRTVEELEILLKRQYALQELKATGNIKKVESIGGFISLKANSRLDFVLSQKNSAFASGKYELQPWFYEEYNSSIQLKHFRVVRRLGSGGFSLVYLAQDKLKGNFHALKLIDKSFILDSEREMIVENQRFVLGQLIASPFITPLRFCFQTKHHFAFAIEYCPGGELFYQLKKVKRMTQAQAKFYFLEILIGLDHLHSKKIIYRDLKPQNLLIGSDGHIRIADFGLAKPLLGREAAYSFCGSPQYMAPQMLKKSGHGVAIDYYCLGALLYQLVVGVPPFYSLDHHQIYHGVLNQNIQFPDNLGLSNEIINILNSLLEKDPSKRLGSRHGVKEIMIHPWVGKINRKQIQNKKLNPPFIPDLSTFNFDESELNDRNRETSKKIADDMRCASFQTHFNNDFYFADSSFLPELSGKRAKNKRSIKFRSLQKQVSTSSLMRRVISDRGKSK